MTYEDMNRSLATILVATILVAGIPLVACHCTDPRVYTEGQEPLDSTSDGSTSTDDTTSDDEATTETTEVPIDVSRFMGVFHNEFDLIPFGREVPNPGSPTIANLEIRPNGTAHMTMETCSELYGTLEISLRWEARPGPILEFSPGPGEESLRFMAWADLESVRATLIDGCGIVFEIDGEPLPTERFRPGRACWVNRCMPTWTVHIDYCPGEAPPPCE